MAEEGALWRWQHAGVQSAAVRTERVEFAAIGGWRDDDHSSALGCYLKSASLARTPLPRPGKGDVRALLEDREKARGFFEQNFAASRIVAEPGLLTSYFQPALGGSRTPSREFSIPVYRRPPDLQPLPPGHPLCAAGLTAGREAAPERFGPYFTRREIEGGALSGQGLEILYLADAIDAFIMHVQCSGRIQLDDGTAVELSFDGKNGHPYTSIARLLIERGDLSREDADLDGMTAWLRRQADPQSALNENKSYIFFRELDQSEAGPKGSLGATLTAGRSLAADPLYHRPGIPIWIVAPDLVFDGQPFQRLAIAQDTGSAIKGPQRADIYAGAGGQAGRIAGRVRHSCEFIILQPKC